MSIITISRGSYSSGKEIAEKVAERLGYQVTSREAYIEASQKYNVPELKLVRAINEAPSMFNRFSFEKEKYLAYIWAAIVRHLRNDNMVYHGLAGHFLLMGVSHVLKVRIIADMGTRVANEMKRENISEKEARHILMKDDEERRKWSKSLFGIDTWDPSLYDFVLNISKLTVDDAVDIIEHTVKLKHFQTTPESKKAMNDLWLACEVKAVLLDVKPDIEVSASDGIVLVKTRAHISQEEHLVEELKKAGKRIAGVKEVRVDVIPL